MSYLDKLLKGVEVEWKNLGDLSVVGTGRSNRQDENENGQYAFYVRSKNILKSNTFQFDETAIVIPGEGGIGDIFHYVQGKYALHQRAYRIKVTTDELSSKFLYYYMCDNFKSYILTKSVGATSISIRKPMLEKFPIPILPLKIQKEIVRILDTFTKFTAELKAELLARKQQYNYYRDQLLSFEAGEVEWKPLGEVGEIKRGVAFTKKQAVIGKFPVVANAAEPICFHNVSNRNGEFIVVARSGANAGLISYWNEELFLTDAFSIHPNDSILITKFVFFYLKNYQREIHLMKRGSGVPHVRASDFEIYQIPIPPIEEQERIVAILEKFDTLTNSISEGLPKEIELRNKQYEYYRDMLLTFPQQESV